jgi:uncharacterized protein (DUF885 family)
MGAVTSIAGLADELAEAEFSNDPFGASYMGIGGYEHAVPDLSPAAQQAWRDRLVGFVIRCDSLGAQAGDADSRVLLAATRDSAARWLAIVDSRVAEFSVTTMPLGGPSRMLFTMARASVADPASATAYLTRCRAVPGFLDQETHRLREAASSGLLPVAPLVADVISQLRDHLAHPDRDPLLAHRPPAGWDGATAWQGEVDRIVRDGIRPAIGRYLDLLVELRPASRPSERAGLLHVPGGTAAYACCVRNGTTLAADADEIHRVGLTALAEAEERIAELGARVLGARSASDVMARMREDNLAAPAGEEAMARAATAIARAEGMLADLFHPPLPPACIVEPMPQHMAASGAPPMYSPPARDGSRAGAYLFNQDRPGPAGGWALEAAAFHEGVPGHHAQYARIQLAPDLPLLLTAFGVVPHSEGWGLYAESLADESGLYSDDMQRLGMLACVAWRAVRLVVDTGLHARGWSRARALEYALAHTPMPEPFMSAEIDRYIAVPGQALGYLVGQREIVRLRESARARLGPAYDIRDFHSAVLDRGSLPLPVLSQVVEEWVTSASGAAARV